MASFSKESPPNNPGLHTSPDEATKDYIMQQNVSALFTFRNTCADLKNGYLNTA